MITMLPKPETGSLRIVAGDDDSISAGSPMSPCDGLATGWQASMTAPTPETLAGNSVAAARPTATATVTEPLPGQLIRQLQLFQLLDVSPATGARMNASGRIGPRPIRLTGGRGCVRYELAEVLAWLSNRRSDGTLHDAKTWPAVWASLQRKERR